MYVNEATKELNFKIALAGDAAISSARELRELFRARLVDEPKLPPLASGEIVQFVIGTGELRGYQIRAHVYAWSPEVSAENQVLLARGAEAAALLAKSGAPAESIAAQLRGLRGAIGGAALFAGFETRLALDEPLMQELKLPAKQLFTARPEAARLGGALDRETLLTLFRELLRESLTRAREPAPATASLEPPPNTKWAQLGPYRFLVPDFFLDLRTENRGQQHSLSAIPARNLSFTALLIDAGGDAEDVESYLAEAVPSYQAEEGERSTVKLAGIPFERLLLRRPRHVSQDPHAQVEIFVASIDDDLFSIAIAQLEAGETLRGLRDLCVKMTEGALLRRMNQS